MIKFLIATIGIIAIALTLKKLPVVRAQKVSQTQQLPTSSSQLTAIPGTRVLLTPPENFILSDRFSGYQEEATNSSIVVTEIPGSISEVAAGFTDSLRLAARGLFLLSQADVTVAKQQAQLLQLQQKAYGTVFEQWVLLLGDDTESVIVTATFPQALAPEYSERLKQSLLSVELDRNLQGIQTDNLPFQVRESGDLKLAQRVSNSLLYSRDGIFPASSVDDPLFIVAPSVSPQFSDPEAFARNRLMATTGVTEIEVEEIEKIVVDDLSGYEIIAQGKDQKRQEEIFLYQAILFDEESYYYLLQGLISNRFREQYLPIFQQMTDSFERHSILPKL